MRAPSSFHSTAAGWTFASAAPMSAAGWASIGWSGWPTRRRSAASPGSPSVRAIVATAPRSPRSMSPRRTEASLTSAAFATASVITPASAPWRRSPASSRTRNRCSASLVRAMRSPSRRRRSATDPGPAHAPIRSNAASTSATVRSDAPSPAAGASRSAAQPTPICRWRSSPDRNATPAGTSAGSRRRSAPARWATFSRRADVAPTARDVSTSSARSTTQSWPNVLPLDRTSVCSVRCVGRQRCVHGPLAFPRPKLD